MPSVWPDVAAAASPGRKVRDQLDYVVWISEVMEPAGFHGGADQDEWRRRVQRAYSALVDAMASGHGDPFPPDVPPAVRPGTWPDVPAGVIPGMTVRHQLAAVRTVAGQSRTNRLFPHTPADVIAWTARVQAAFDALDHGPAMAMPETARTTPPSPPPSAPKARAGAARRAKAKPAGGAAGAGKAGAAKTRATARTAPRASSKKRKKG